MASTPSPCNSHPTARKSTSSWATATGALQKCSTVLSPAPRVQASTSTVWSRCLVRALCSTPCATTSARLVPQVAPTTRLATTTTLPTWTTALVSTWLPRSCPTAATTLAKVLSWVCSSAATLRVPATTSSWRSTTPPETW